MLCSCRRTPEGDWHLETGRARFVDETGGSIPRMEAVRKAQDDARLKLLRAIEAMPVSDSNLVGDYIAQNPVVATRIRSLVLSARRFATRYKDDGTVEVDMGVNLDEVRRIIQRATR